MASPLLDSYFATLMAAAGAREMVLLNDHALPLDGSNPLHHSRRSGRKSQRRNSPTCSFGPPSFPLRKASSDNLDAIKRTVRQQQQVISKKNNRNGNDLDCLLLQRGSNGTKTTFQKTGSNQSWKEGKASNASSSRGALFRGMVAEVLETSSSFSPGKNNNNGPPTLSRTSVVDYIDEVEKAVSSAVACSSPSRAANNSKRRDTRWMVGMEQQLI
jgi:hypothetical protein